MNIIFMGTPDFAVPVLEKLLEKNYHIQAVVTQPDRKVGRKHLLQPTPVKEVALKHDIPVLQPEKLSQSAEMQTIIDMQPDLIITAAFGQFLPQAILDVPKYGCLNVHGSLLPKYRGGAPIQHAIMNGETKTGITIMEMVKKMDAGAIVNQKAIPITKQDDAGTIFDALSVLGADLLVETIPDYVAGKITPQSQDEEQATYSPNISREEEQINWQKTAEQIDYQVRGLRPWPIAYTLWQGKRLKVWQVTPLTEQTDLKPGTVVERTKKQLKIAAGNGTVLSLDCVQPAGKGKMDIVSFLNGVGKDLQVGDSFDE